MNEKTAVNAIRILAVDQVQKANSGHPGFPLGGAPVIYSLFADCMNHDPSHPAWFNRDRFVLSGGHGSAMLYATLHLFGYPKVDIDALKGFRQLGTVTPGHPEFGLTPGVEATTGPLGAGMGMAVGIAIAEAHLAHIFGKIDIKPIDHFTFAYGGEGCFMEGVSSEVFSLAGTLGLGKLIIIMDSNDVTIEGNTKIAFTEDVDKRMESYGFGTFIVEDGNDLSSIRNAITEAKADFSRPSFIRIKSQIGFGVPDRVGTAKAHGEPIGEGNVEILRRQLDWTNDEAFFVPQEIYDLFKEKGAKGTKIAYEWMDQMDAYRAKYPQDAMLLDKYLDGSALEEAFGGDFFDFDPKIDATRNISGRILNELADKIPNLIGGSADLAPSNKTELKGKGDFSSEDYTGRNLHFGVRELGMTAIANGILLHGGLRSYISTFFVFSDYTKPMLRLSSLMEIPLIAVFTHDSIGVGEDGPTHEPIEQLSMLRAQPNLNVWRPADEAETRYAYMSAIFNAKTPSVFALTRQNIPPLEGSGRGALKGGYIVAKEEGSGPDLILMASGSEVSICLEAKAELDVFGISTRVVSMPCMDVFERQPQEYKDEVLPAGVTKRIAVEAGSSLSWGKLVGISGDYVCLDHFGASAPAKVLFEEFGITVQNIVEKAKIL
jgi:transketolase